jgi:hypothetical protein
LLRVDPELEALRSGDERVFEELTRRHYTAGAPQANGKTLRATASNLAVACVLKVPVPSVTD